MPPGILAGHVDIEFVMGVFDDGNAEALAAQMRITRDSKVVLPAPLQPARPMTFIRFHLRNPLHSVIASAAKQSSLPAGVWIASLPSQ